MYGSTNIGRVRKENQDSIYYDETMSFGVVADGIGGRNGGRVASSLAVAEMRSSVIESDMIRHDQVDSFLINAVDKANEKIIEQGKKDESVAGMGTTLNGVMFFGDKLHIVHIGDSRTYLYEKGHLFQLTVDHNVKNLLRRGEIDQSSVQPNASTEALVKALGLMEQCDPDIYAVNVRAGQIFLTCSDGLHSMVDNQKILQTLIRFESKPNELPKRLIDEANKNGGRDNITVLLSIVKAG